MAFLVLSPEITTVSTRSFPGSSLRHVFMRKKVTVSARDLSGVKNQKSRLYVKFSAPVKEDCHIIREEDDKQSYYVNMGHAVRCLREELPSLFYKEPNFDIYRDDVVLRDPLNTFMGIDNYKSILWALRFHGRIFFKALCVDIVSIWQPTENTLMIRWTVHGIPRGPWQTRGRFDGTSEYKFDKNGKIYEHKVDNMAVNSPPKFQMLNVQELVEAISCTPKPTYFVFRDSSSSWSETY
ncbi:hypothetical protein Bca52824_049976 [Brassica carinata]|uniref:Uncharacterized protein n=3 Tax=Brassica TaxID=3705 RepID=A0A0D2ZTU0_BRAOL|nr:PREDICTED: uncharacterized protein LOC106320934 [Brassica oleracea var. oleracea]KAG2290372.1 hypothetical protein Bca52824_049976 [Brassica carinata]